MPVGRGAILAVAMLVAVACTTSNGDSGGSLSEAFCNDLEAGLTPMQIYNGAIGRYDSPKDFADNAYGFAAIDCPDQLRSNEPLRTFLEGWGIDPDA